MHSAQLSVATCDLVRLAPLPSTSLPRSISAQYSCSIMYTTIKPLCLKLETGRGYHGRVLASINNLSSQRLEALEQLRPQL